MLYLGLTWHFHWISPIALWPILSLFVLASLFYFMSSLRLMCIVKPMMSLLAGVLPPISKTEQEAIDAGDVWWEKELFRGKPSWKTFLKRPKQKLSKAEQSFIDNEVNELCEMLDDWKIYKEKDLSKKVWQFIRSKGFFGLVIDKKYGGKGFSAFAHSSIVLKIVSKSISAGVTTMVPNSLGPAELLIHYGTDEQKKHYLPRLAKGQEVPCFALTGVEAGSDAGAMQDFGVVCKGQYKNKTVLGIKLNFDKRYITLAPVATLIGLAFKLFDPDQLLGDQEDIGITVALIPAAHPGVKLVSVICQWMFLL